MSTLPSYARTDHPHASSVDDVVADSQTSLEGLTQEVAGRRLTEVGPNRLPEAERVPAWKRFLRHFNDVLIYVLIAAAVVTAFMQEWIDTAVILSVVIVNAVIGYVQEGKAEKALEGIRSMLSASARVRRDGAWIDVPADELVPGDLIQLGAGDRVPADARLVEDSSLQVEEAALTGESVPADKSPEPVAADAGIGDRSSMVFSGTLVTGGRGTAVVTATGAETEIGAITTMLADVETIETPLTRQMNRFGAILSVVVGVIAIALILIGYFVHSLPVGDLLLASVGFAVAAIPEGLPAVLTITLARGVQIMATQKAITRRLGAVETLGSVTVVCSDKTGTLTKNEMTVRGIVTSAGRYDVTGTGYAPEGTITRDGHQVARGDHPDLDAVLLAAGLVNDAVVAQRDGRWTLAGEPTEGALRTVGLKLGFQGDEVDRLDEVPFDSANKYMATLHRLPAASQPAPGDRDERMVVLLKGAPDQLLGRCDRQGVDETAETPLDRANWDRVIDDLGGHGLRVLGVAIRSGTGISELTEDDVDAGGFVFLGLLGIIDPPRPEAIEAIASCQRAGIDVKMITGDHAGTASAIARQMGIADEHRPVITGAEIERTDDEQLRTVAAETNVFARTSPEHKLRLVTALQADRQVVAMTGDGVNDAPALKRADVGVAMGVKGTEATKESADVVLADDNFATLERAVEEGRTIYDNLRKAIAFTLPTNGAQSLVILVAVLLGLTLPLTPIQILWVNLVVAVTLALALAFEPSEPGIMDRPPRDPDTGILEARHVWRIAFISILIGAATIAVFRWAQDEYGNLELARTLALNTLVTAQAFYLINARRLDASSLSPQIVRTNPVAWGCIGLLAVIQLVFVYAPFMQTWFESTPLTASQWLIPGAVGIGVFVLAEIEKFISRRVAAATRRRATPQSTRR